MLNRINSANSQRTFFSKKDVMIEVAKIKTLIVPFLFSHVSIQKEGKPKYYRFTMTKQFY